MQEVDSCEQRFASTNLNDDEAGTSSTSRPCAGCGREGIWGRKEAGFLCRCADGYISYEIPADLARQSALASPILYKYICF